MIFYGYILDIVIFDIAEVVFRFDLVVEWLFGLPENDPVSESADSLGYGSHFIITNLAALLVTFVILVCIYCILLLFYEFLYLIGMRSGRVFSFAKEWTRNFKWNGLIAFFNETYFPLCIVVFFNRDALDFTQGWAIIFNSCFAIFCAISLIVVPFII